MRDDESDDPMNSLTVAVAAGTLVAFEDLTYREAVAVMEARAYMLRVPICDVAAYVELRGILPSFA